MTQFGKSNFQANAPLFGASDKKASPVITAPKPKIDDKAANAKQEQKALFQEFATQVASETKKEKPRAIAARGLAWSYFTACLYTFFATQVLITIYTIVTSGFGGLEDKFIGNTSDSLLMARNIFIFGIAAKILSAIAHTMTVEPRMIYIINGFTLGLVMAGGDYLSGQTIQPLSYCFCVSGAFGGYMFWRSRGCPVLVD